MCDIDPAHTYTLSVNPERSTTRPCTLNSYTRLNPWPTRTDSTRTARPLHGASLLNSKDTASVEGGRSRQRHGDRGGVLGGRGGGGVGSVIYYSGLKFCT